MVELRTINKDNFEECLKLKVSDDQKTFVATNVFSLAQAWVYYENTYPFAIYADDVMVGFVMMGYDTEKNQYSIFRFMIDSRYQNKGYGKAALKLSVEYLRKEHNAKEVYLSFEPNNFVAEKLYSNFGFERTGEIDHGEVVMRLDVLKG